ncbi:MAG: hypothetical protein H6Q90_5396 [Deltaproteobacteria bacterium]|nr:hypothetical protein [Deltaproteobacteria bacterium]
MPLVVAPRYVPGTATNRPTTGTGRAPDTDRAPDASRVTPGGAPGAGGPTKLMLHFVDQVSDVASPTHELHVTGADAELTDPRTDHDAVVRWKTPVTAGGWVEQSPDGGYAAVVVEAPAAPARKGTLRCLLVLDRSAAARGDADATARPLVRAMLAALGPGDRIAVAGSDQIAWTTPADAARLLEQSWNKPAGAFDLTRVLAAARPGGASIVLVSGGLVADDAAAVAAAARLGVSVQVVGVGPAPARGLLAQLAAVSGGTLRIAVPGDDVAAMAKSVLADVASPPLPLTVTWGTLAASEVVPGTLPRVGAGQATIVLARVNRAQRANARAGGELFSIESLPSPRLVDGATTTMGPLARRWARNRLDELLAARASAAVVTAHALRYGLVSPYTSMVAIGDEVIVQGGVKHSVAVPVSVPAGMKWQAVKKQTEAVFDGNLGEADAKQDSLTRQKSEQTAEPRSEPKPDPIAKHPRRTAPGMAGGSDKHKDATKESANRAPFAAGPPRAPSPAPMTSSDNRDAAGDEGDDEDSPRANKAVREVAVAGMPAAEGESQTMEISAPTQLGRLRLTTSFGGGLWHSRGETTSVLALGTRVEVGLGGRAMAGVDAALWLVDGEDVAGHVLATFAHRGLGRWLELGLGLGLHFDNGAGPAAAVSLRYHLRPAPRAAAYLRYDGALIYGDERRGESSFTLGLEWGF